MRLRFGLAVAAAACVVAASTACSSVCVRKDERITVAVSASPTFNAANGTPQPVKFRVWAIKDKAAFDAVAPAKLVETDVASLERLGFGRAFGDGTDTWIRPGGSIEVAQKTTEDNQFTHIAITVRYPQPKTEVVALDCAARSGYTLNRPEHRIVFTLDGESIRVGGAEPAAH